MNLTTLTRAGELLTDVVQKKKMLTVEIQNNL